LANGSYRRQGGEAGGPGPGSRAPVKPGYEPVHIDRSGRRDMLEMGFRQTAISGVPQPKAAYALGQCPFDTGSSLIVLLPFFTAIPGPRRLQRLKLRLRMQFQAPGGLRRSGAARPHPTVPTVLLAEPHLDICGARVVDRSAQLPDVLPCGQCTC
jgi:hypothetical protein